MSGRRFSSIFLAGRFIGLLRISAAISEISFRGFFMVLDLSDAYCVKAMRELFIRSSLQFSMRFSVVRRPASFTVFATGLLPINDRPIWTSASTEIDLVYTFVFDYFDCMAECTEETAFSGDSFDQTNNGPNCDLFSGKSYCESTNVKSTMKLGLHV